MASITKQLDKAVKAAILLTQPIWRHGLRHGVAATIEHRPLRRLIQPRTVIDIGANKGQFTLFALQAWPAARVFAFEPLPGPAARFRAVARPYPQVRLFEAAIGPKPGEADIHLSEREDSSSLLPIGERMQSVFPEARAAGRTLRVPVGPLHTFLAVDDLAPPVLLKLDVQGFELEALKGCERLLAAIDHLYVECSYLELYVGQALFADIDGYLRRHGFTNAAEINRVERAGIGRVQSDCLFAAARAAGGVPA